MLCSAGSAGLEFTVWALLSWSFWQPSFICFHSAGLSVSTCLLPGDMEACPLMTSQTKSRNALCFTHCCDGQVTAALVNQHMLREGTSAVQPKLQVQALS